MPEGPKADVMFAEEYLQVFDHGVAGIEVRFELPAEEGGSKWFTDGAADQFREVAPRGEVALRAFAVRRIDFDPAIEMGVARIRP